MGDPREDFRPQRLPRASILGAPCYPPSPDAGAWVAAMEVDGTEVACWAETEQTAPLFSSLPRSTFLGRSLSCV